MQTYSPLSFMGSLIQSPEHSLSRMSTILLGIIEDMTQEQRAVQLPTPFATFARGVYTYRNKIFSNSFSLSTPFIS